jgi:hypothetical protein
MSISSVAHGDQAATVPTDHTLDTQSTPGVYVLVVDTNVLVAGDILVLTIKTKATHDGTTRIAFQAIYSGVQVEPIKYSPPIPVDQEIVCILNQTNGTSRTFPWSLLIA